MNPLTKVVLNYFDRQQNSNKVWIGEIFNDGSFVASWGRIRAKGKLQSQTKKFTSIESAHRELEIKKREKISKGYRETQVLSNSEIAISATILSNIATSQIQGSKDPTTKNLIEYLAKVNIHSIASNSLIRYDESCQSLSTPLGRLMPSAIALARNLLTKILQCDPQSDFYKRDRLIDEYFCLIPQDFGMKIPDASFLLKSSEQIQAQENLLDALEAALLLLRLRSVLPRHCLLVRSRMPVKSSKTSVCPLIAALSTKVRDMLWLTHD
jgi:poly [ADP-ribose] polymerase 2/3/4